MFKKNILFLSVAFILAGCFGGAEDENSSSNASQPNDTEILQHEDDVLVTNPVDAVLPIVEGDEFNENMKPVLKQSLSEIKATRAQSGQAWDYAPYMPADKVAMFQQKDQNFHQDYPNINLTDARISVIGAQCVASGYPTGLTEEEYDTFKEQVTLRTHTASLVFIEQPFDIDMTTEQALQTVLDMRVWYRYTYDMAENKNALCSKVQQSYKDASANEDKIWSVLKDPEQVGVEMARYAVSNEIRSSNVAFCASLLASNGMIDNQSDLAGVVIDNLSEKAAAATTSSVKFPKYVSGLKEPLLLDAAETLSDMTAKQCLLHSDAITSLALIKSHLDDPRRLTDVIDEGEVSAEDLPPVNLDEIEDDGE